MSFESYRQIVADADTCIRPQKTFSISFDGEGSEDASRLFITGETNISPFWKTEPDYQMLYRRLDDALRSDVANKDRFCLDFSDSRRDYPKIAFKKLVAPLSTPMFVLNGLTDGLTFGISAKAKNLRVYGTLRVTLEVRYQREGVGVHSTVHEPDCVFTVDIPEGSYDWQALSSPVSVDIARVANICYLLEGEDYEGEVYFEAPRLTVSGGYNLVGQFLPHTADTPNVNWMGQNLSHIEWIGLRVAINQTTVFDGEVFERCHRFSEAELPLPAGIIRKGENTLTVTCTSHYRDAAGYLLREIGLISEKRSPFIAAPSCVTVGKPFAVCVEGKKGERLAWRSETVAPMEEPILQRDGLNVLRFVTHTPQNGQILTLAGEDIHLLRAVEREEDGVITGTGDMVYININERSVKDYIKWYLSEGLGNLLTVRPTYRWNGTRTVASSVYEELASLLDGLGIFYSHMLDGRELPGCNLNPTLAALQSPHFLGRQTHEFDGQFSYWPLYDVTGNLSEQMFYDLFLRMYRRHGATMNQCFIPENVHYTDQSQTIFRTAEPTADMQEAAERFLASLKNSRKGVLRHTGPATLFKYFYQAGYTWVGAETMYSPTEITLAALRGAKGAYGGRTGTHLAVQWSSTPHNTESHYRRYRLALFVSYMLGIDEINTEEGLWRLEEFYSFHHRFTEGCLGHTQQQKDFVRYLATHTRRGSFYTPIAFLNGRYDGWSCFGRETVFGVKDFVFGDMERAWDLLSCFYPKSVLNSIVRHPCPDEEVGYHSGTPLGNVDILPIEAESYSSYRLLIAVGYNKAEEKDMEKLRAFVEAGGTLLIGWPQLSTTTLRKDAEAGHHAFLDGKERSFVEDTYEGQPLSVCESLDCDSILLRTDAGRPLIVTKHIGKGCLYFVNAREYAGAPAVASACRYAIGLLSEKAVSAERVYAKGNRNVAFSVFEKENGDRDIYFLATDWHKPKGDGTGTLSIGGTLYEIAVPFGSLVKVSVSGEGALYPLESENEVIAFDGTSARLSGEGSATFVLCKNGEKRPVTVDFTRCSVQAITL